MPLKAMSTYKVVNLGCKVNRVEADAVITQLSQAGLRYAKDLPADLVVINTCTVTGEAEKKTRKALHRTMKDDPHALIVVTGCSAALHADEYRAFGPNVRVVQKADLLSFLSHICAAVPQRTEGASESLGLCVRRGVKVQDGCDRACTYCIVHVARGRASSVAVEQVVDQCRELFSQGVPEVLLTGINLGAYQNEGHDLAALLLLLLEELDLASGGIQGRIRLSSIEPQDVTDDLIRVIAGADGIICRHLHLPLQSGSSRVLAQMDRGYDAGHFEDVILRIRAAIPQISLSTDVIAGFPGETEEDFAETVSLCEDSRFMKLHVFPYSPREGTPAAKRNDQIPAEVKNARARHLRLLSDRLSTEDLMSRSGKEEVAVVESADAARTESYHVIAPPAGSSVGSLIRLRFPV